jgi:hypothetical protein
MRRYHIQIPKKIDKQKVSSWHFANSWTTTTFKLIPRLYIRNSALQRTGQIDVEQRSVETMHNRNPA